MAEITKPTDLPEWATTLANDGTTGQPNRAEPSSGKKITGFTFNEKPPRQNFNWLFYTLGTWIAWLNSVLNQALLTTSSPTFASLTLAELFRTAGQLTIRTITSGILLIQSAGALTLNATGLINFLKGFKVWNGEAEVASIDDDGNITGRAVITGTDFSVRGSTTDVTGTELETLSDGSIADSLHVHAADFVAYSFLYRAQYTVPAFAFADGYKTLALTAQITEGMTPYTNGVQITQSGDYRITLRTHLTGTATVNSAVPVAILKNGSEPTAYIYDSEDIGASAVSQYRLLDYIFALEEGDVITAGITTLGIGTISVDANYTSLVVEFLGY